MIARILHAEFLFVRVHPASLALTRILFGFLMIFDIAEERGGSEIDIRWGDPRSCNFPLFTFMSRPSFPWMCLLFGLMWFGALGICVGFKFRISCVAYLLPYWYILLLDKSFWNNHSYLYGLLAFLLSISSAGEYWSLDAYLQSKNKQRSLKKTNDTHKQVAFWNYFLLRFQVFNLYFLAGLKKLDMEWLEGYSMTNLGTHWVFIPFGLIFTTEQIDYLVVHIIGFLLDLTVGFFLLSRKSRPIAMLFCGVFHLMNSRLFSIGMFPYVGIVTMPIFCDPSWPVFVYETLRNLLKMKSSKNVNDVKLTKHEKEPTKENGCHSKASTKQNSQQALTVRKTCEYSAQSQRCTVFFIIVYCLVQLFLPWSHFITKGYNNWTNGLYGYSWDMMVHSWDTTLVIVRIVDNTSGKELFLDPSAWVHNDRWNKHADMALQYAQCIQRNLIEEKMHHNAIQNMYALEREEISENISVYVDVWCSLNGRFQQRMFHPHYDLLKANWSAFSSVEWLLPLLIEYNDFREKMKAIQADVYSWSNYSDVLFVADFPDLLLENFITKDLTNISLVIIKGAVLYESEEQPTTVLLKEGESIGITSNVFHKIKTVSRMPSCFMYTYINSTKAALNEVNQDRGATARSPFPIVENSYETMESFSTMFGLIGNALLHVLYDVPMVRRARIE